MCQYPSYESVLVMDNASIHKSLDLALHLHAFGYIMQFLPAYCPKFNPIEECFSYIKGYLKSNNGDLWHMSIIQAIFQAGASITAEHMQGYYRHAGYE